MAIDFPATPYSLVIITLNAVKQLESCLSSAPSASEIVVVDSGSTDGTQALAKKLGATVIDQPWLGFGPQKQFAVNSAQHDWVLCLDADEALSPELHRSIVQTLSSSPSATSFRLARRNHFMGRALNHGEGYPDWNTRLFNRQHAQWSDDMVHERVLCDKPSSTLDGDLLHESALQINQYLNKQNSYTTTQALTLYRQGKRASFSKLLLSPLARFIRYYFLKQGFRDGIPGLVHISIGSFNSFVKYAKLAELHRTNGEPYYD